MKAQQVAIIGSAVATALGVTRDQTWGAVMAGKCGIAQPTAIESPLPPGADAGQAMNLPVDFEPGLPREARYLKWTIEEAIRDAGLVDGLPVRTGVILGTTLHGIRAAGQFLRDGNADPLAHFLAGNTIELSTDKLSIRGLRATTCSACSSSLGAIALATTLLQTGKLDLVIAGGYDTISEYAYGGFNSLRLVADGPLRPFARDRRGMKLAEGYGIVILQRLADAENHPSRIHALIAGFGESADAHHLTQPHPQGRGASRAMAAALASAELNASQIQMIAAHATGTPDNDAGEYAALANTFGKYLPEITVVGFKSHLGHTLGGAGAVELILSSCALRSQYIPPCANSRTEDVEFPGLNLSVAAKPTPIQNVLNTSLGFGGANTCMILSAFAPHSGTSNKTSNAPPESKFQISHRAHDVAITGVGILLPNAIGNDAFLQLLSDSSNIEKSANSEIAESQYIHLLNARRIRRMSDYVKLSLAAANLACADAGITGNAEFLSDCAVLLGSTHGSSSFCSQYYKDIVAQGLPGANPTLFAEGVPNSAAAHLSLMLGIQGACQTIIGTRTAGLDALNLAALRIASGQWDRALVGACEEHSPIVDDAYRHCGLLRASGGANDDREPGFITSSGAICFVLERADHAQQARRRIRGFLRRGAASSNSPLHLSIAIGDVLNEIGSSPLLFTSSNATWINRAEQSAIQRHCPAATLKNMYRYIAETFSVGPLAGIASILLQAHQGAEKSFSALCSDYSGCAAASMIECE